MTDDSRHPPRVTQREGGRVTRREGGRVTQRETVPHDAGTGPVEPTTIAGRYWVVAPLSAPGGEATVYRCRDTTQAAREVAVKLYHIGRQPKDEALQPLLRLRSRHVVSLLDYGQWRGQFYEVQEYCAGGSLLAGAPYDEDRLREMLEQILAGLHQCHQQNLAHRDLKPSNLLFRDAERREVVVADFGISSVLDDAGGLERITRTRANTLDYAAPELFGAQVVVSPKVDYYALGITLAHLRQNRSPFHGLPDSVIIAAHVRGAISWPSALSPAFQTLLTGLTQADPANRWGYRQVGQWLRGEAIQNDRGQPWRATTAGTGLPSYPGCPKARTPVELAAALDNYPQAQQDLFKGYIRQWVFQHDPDLARRIETIEENDTRQPKLGLLKLKILLDPSLPLKVGNHTLRTLADLTRVLDRPDAETRQALDQRVWDESLETWIAATQGPAGPALAQEIAGVRQRLRTTGQIGLVVTVLSYLLDAGRPFLLRSNTPLKHLAELETVLAEHPGAEAALEDALFDGHLEEWLRAARFDHWQQDTMFLRDCRQRHAEDRRLGGYALRWHWNPHVPLPLGNRRISDPRALARCIDRDRAARDAAHVLLTNGWLRTWLVASGRCDPGPLDRVLNDAARSPGDQLEAFLHLCDPQLAWPTPASSDARLEFGGVSTEAPQTRQVTLRNGGRGYLAGVVRLRRPVEGLTVAPQRIEGQAVQVPVTVDCAGLRAETVYQAELVVESNGGTLTVPIRFRVAPPWAGMVGRSLGTGLAAGFLFMLYRLFAGGLFPAGNRRVLDWVKLVDPDRLQTAFPNTGGPVATVIGLILLAAALVGGVVGVLRYWVRSGHG
ncbi:MAG: serine/threonine-protein kinase [Candidatus Competibacter sp.]|nr:serine/threonine-protein kinase [Candidatus Competibacter sp.]